MDLVESTIVTAKVADFGYSQTYLSSEDKLSVARTTPWCAPEVTERSDGYLSHEAKLTDIYSFGMMCLWMIFADELAQNFGIHHDMTDFSTADTQEQISSFTKIKKLKDEDRLRLICKDLILRLPLQPNQKVSLTKVFNSSLARDPLQRTLDMEKIRALLDDSLNDSSGFPAEMIPDIPSEKVDMEEHRNFQVPVHDCRFLQITNFLQISESVLQFLQGDVRVREFIFQSLLGQAESSTCFACQSNAAFQTSICFAIGFGIPADMQSCQQWLQRSGKSGIELERILNGMREYAQVEEPHLYHTHLLNNLQTDGYLRNIDYLDTYLPAISFEKVKNLYEREIADLVSCLGSGAFLALSLKGVYATILREAGHYQEAADIQTQCVEQLLQYKTHDGTENPNAQVFMSALAETYRRQGDFQQAEHYNSIVKSRRTETLGPDHPLTLACLQVEGILYNERGFPEDAERTYKLVIEKRKQTIGTYHVGTLNAMSDLGNLYLHQMRYEEAAAILEEERGLCETLLGNDHYNTLVTLTNLANAYIGLGKDEAAQGLLERALFGLRLTFGEDHPMIYSVMASLGALFYSLEAYPPSLVWYNKALLGNEKLLGADHPSTTQVARSMASVLVAMDADFEKIKMVYERCIGAQKRLVGENHREYLETQSDYCHFLFERGHLHDAELGYRELIEHQETCLGPKHGALAVSLCKLGQILSKLGKQDADVALRRAVDLSMQYGEGHHEMGWECMEALADHLHNTGSDLHEAETLYRRIIATKRADPNIEAIELYSTLDSLADLSMELGDLQQAIVVRREMIELSETFDELGETVAGEYNEDRVVALAELAFVLYKSKQYDDAEQVYRKALELAIATFGDSGERTLHIEAQLAWILDHQGQHKEARVLVEQALEKSKASPVTEGIRLEVMGKAAAVFFRQGDQAAAIALSKEVVDGTLVVFGAESERLNAAEANHTLYCSGVAR
jgi:tetratricopeptide (TPR) repeat protein